MCKKALLPKHIVPALNLSISRLWLTCQISVKSDWLAIRPNTDTALMLGLCYTLLDEGLQDSDFLDRYCTGFDVFATYLHGTEDGCTKSADWAAAICGLPADDIRNRRAGWPEHAR